MRRIQQATIGMVALVSFSALGGTAAFAQQATTTAYPPETLPPASTAATIPTTTSTTIAVKPPTVPTDPATAEAATSSQVKGAALGALPTTGSDVGTPVKIATGLGAAGLAALLIARRRRPAPTA